MPMSADLFSSARAESALDGGEVVFKGAFEVSCRYGSAKRLNRSGVFRILSDEAKVVPGLNCPESFGKAALGAHFRQRPNQQSVCQCKSAGVVVWCPLIGVGRSSLFAAPALV